jgi:alcohol oxidase
MDDALDFETGFLADVSEIDLKTHIWLFKKQREVARRMKMYEGEVAGHQPAYTVGSKAATAPAIQGDDASLIEYTEEDDSVIADYVRRKITTCVSWFYVIIPSTAA